MSEVKIPAEIQDIKEFSPLQVVVGSNFEDALRRFKSLVQKSKRLSLYKEKQHYEKPSEKKRRKRREAAERRRLTDLREKMMANGEWEQKQKRKDSKRKERYNSEEEEWS
jgi:small subunit ribosomal protein S21